MREQIDGGLGVGNENGGDLGTATGGSPEKALLWRSMKWNQYPYEFVGFSEGGRRCVGRFRVSIFASRLYLHPFEYANDIIESVLERWFNRWLVKSWGVDCFGANIELGSQVDAVGREIEVDLEAALNRSAVGFWRKLLLSCIWSPGVVVKVYALSIVCSAEKGSFE